MRTRLVDYRTVAVEKGGLAVLVRYGLYQNGQERDPESTNCGDGYAVAYFLTATIRDAFLETSEGFTIERTWQVLPEGEIALSFCLELPGWAGVRYLCPGEAQGVSLSREGLLVDGSLTAYPSAIYLLGEPDSLLVFPHPWDEEGAGSSLELALTERADEPCIRVVNRLPADPLLPSPGRGRVQRSTALHSPGGFTATRCLHLAVSPRREALQKGLEAVLGRLRGCLHRPPALQRATARRWLAAELRSCLDSHLVDAGSICGLRLTPDSSLLSASAGSGMAALLLDSCPGDSELSELGLRLADFALRGQHPGGGFYEHFDTAKSQWRTDTTPLYMADCAATAERLLRLAAGLEERGIPGGKYLLAARRFLDGLLGSGHGPDSWGACFSADGLAPLEAGTGALAAVPPLGRLARLTGRDRYRKALAALAGAHFPPKPEAEPEDRESGLAEDLLAARAVKVLGEEKIPVREAGVYWERLLRWMFFNPQPGEAGFNRSGGLLAGPSSRKLLFRGFRTAHLLWTLGRVLWKDGLPEVTRTLALQLLAFTLQKAPGTAAYSLEDSSCEPVDSRVLVEEMESLGALLAEAPELL